MKKLRALCVAILAPFLFSSCNAFEFADAPSSTRERIEAARFSADDGDCVSARDLLANLTLPDDEGLYVRGFAKLCIAGATLVNIGTTVVTYTSSSGTDYTVIGKLARNLVPYSNAKYNEVQSALEDFRTIADPNRRAYATLVGHLVKLALIVAKSAGTSATTVVRDDIASGTACTDAVTCPAGGMSDADATDFRTEISLTASDAASLGIAGLQDLATALNSTFGALSDTATRYTVRNNVVPAN